VFRSTAELEQAIAHYLAQHNADPKPFVWTKSADEILQALAWTCQRINDSGGMRAGLHGMHIVLPSL
jgi:hypothetical protein